MAFHCAFILPKMIGHKFHTNKIITPFSLPIFFTRFTQGVTEKNEINLHNSRFSKKIFQFFPSPLPTKPVFQLVERHDKMIYTQYSNVNFSNTSIDKIHISQSLPCDYYFLTRHRSPCRILPSVTQWQNQGARMIGKNVHGQKKQIPFPRIF